MAPMTGAAPSRHARTLVLAAHAAALLGLSAIAFHRNLALLFSGLDGVYLLTLAEHQFAWLGPAAGFSASPFQGLGDLWYPMNAWLIPAYLLPHLALGAGAEMGAAFRVAAYVVVAAELFAAIYLLARALGTPRLPALLGAWLLPLLLLPWSGPSLLYPFAMLSAHNATALAEACLMIAAIARLGRGEPAAWAKDAALALAVALLGAHLALSQPNSLVQCVPIVAVAALGCAAGATRRREALVKLGAPAAAVLLLAAIGFAAFFIGLYAYSVPRFWPEELENDRLTWYYVSILFHRSANGWAGPLLFLAGVFGMLHAAWNGERRERRLAAALVALVGALYVLGALTVYWDFWRGPSPLYFEFFLWPLYAIYAARALVALAPAALAPRLEQTPALALSLPLVLAVPLAAAAINGRPGERLYFPLPPVETPIAAFLKARVAPAPGREFAGRAASMEALGVAQPVRWLYLHFYFHAPRAAATGNDHVMVGLWHFGIPTLLEYSSSLSPAFWRVATRFLARPQDPQLRSVLLLRKPDARILGLLGVRYLIADAPQPAPFRLALSEPARPGETLYLYEVPAVNLGQLSPPALRKVGGFAQALDELADARFDPGKVAIVFDEPAGAPLSRAGSSELRMAPGGFTVKAVSAGRSLLVVPFEYSRCLSVRSLDPALPPPRLVRVDAILTGVLFERAADAEVRYFTGPFDGAGCRLRDADELRSLLR